ncbi:MAG: hypothetical protein EZS28_018828 [Streblomastix strix]|uniref:Uncharacterized protein n=1 Tax=Streblomastix strix TaxID=222440 RepID=A0A5J4VU06_9EUKA|nr:MAG: hypothetical protein EZS28_018828 [Streblomastix strix]
MKLKLRNIQGEINNKSKATKTFGHCAKETDIDSPPQMSIAIVTHYDPSLVSTTLARHEVGYSWHEGFLVRNQQFLAVNEADHREETRSTIKDSDIDEYEQAAEVLIKDIPYELVLAADEVGYQLLVDSRTKMIIVKASDKLKKLHFPVDRSETQLLIMSAPFEY